MAALVHSGASGKPIADWPARLIADVIEVWKNNGLRGVARRHAAVKQAAFGRAGRPRLAASAACKPDLDAAYSPVWSSYRTCAKPSTHGIRSGSELNHFFQRGLADGQLR